MGWGFTGRTFLGLNPGPTPITTGTKALFQKKRGPQVKPVQALSIPFYAGVEGGMNPGVKKHGKEAAETKHSQLHLESQRLEAPLVELDLLNRFEISIPIDNSPSLPFFKGVL